MAAEVAHMVEMGLETSVVAPAAVIVTRRWVGWQRLVLPAPIVLPLFLLAHGAITVSMALHDPPLPEHLALHAALFVAAVAFWVPVFGRGRRLTDPGRMLYLFIAMPSMDLAGVYLVLRGQATDGLAMIVAMLPVGLTALGVAWEWVSREEREIREKVADPAW